MTLGGNPETEKEGKGHHPTSMALEGSPHTTPKVSLTLHLGIWKIWEIVSAQPLTSSGLGNSLELLDLPFLIFKGEENRLENEPLKSRPYLTFYVSQSAELTCYLRAKDTKKQVFVSLGLKALLLLGYILSQVLCIFKK